MPSSDDFILTPLLGYVDRMSRQLTMKIIQDIGRVRALNRNLGPVGFSREQVYEAGLDDRDRWLLRCRTGHESHHSGFDD